MGTRKFRPTTPSRRFMSGSDFADLTKGAEVEKSLVAKKNRSGGRNNRGRITSRHRGGGHKRRYRVIDFQRDKVGVEGRVVSIQYDPNRTARIALIHFMDGEKRYILAPDGLKVYGSDGLGNDTVITSDSCDIRPGNCMPLHSIPDGTIVHNVEMNIGRGAQMCRAAGTSATVMAKEGNYVTVRLPSGEMRKVHRNCKATIGVVSNSEHSNHVVGKAGKSRWLGRRPHVRGTAMNPIDHPHGGGEGKSKGRHPVTPWGKPTKGYKTRQRKKPSNKFIVKQRR
jgi:large subunit ribosomal protein L2